MWDDAFVTRQHPDGRRNGTIRRPSWGSDRPDRADDARRAVAPIGHARCGVVLHFNNAAAASPSRPVLDAVTSHLAGEGAIGGYEAAAEAEGRIADVCDAVATLIGAHRDEIASSKAPTRAWEVAFYSVPFREGSRRHRAGRAPAELPRVPADEGARRDRDRRGWQLLRRVREGALRSRDGGLAWPLAAKV
jgi:hypothetical protein